ncbi:unnamed protein product [Lactuca saligna]|uniref:PB1-like domain-containing protein n=1 Tax=Lactuca saligna TaxID=75948 RepID=A0AA35YR82_LACSI|nr:unnamed protein product [Lactuca saligna]
MEEIDVEKHYAGHATIFSTRLFYGGEFRKFPGQSYIKGKERYVDLLDIDEFCVHDIDEMMETLGYVEEGKLLYYHFKRPFSDLDFGLFVLASDSDINHLGTYVGTFADLGQLDPCGPSQSNKESEENKCQWVLYASKWEQDVDWEIKTYGKEHRYLQTRNVKACTYKFLARKIVQQIESNPTVLTRALQEQLQREYQVDISKMKVLRAKQKH